MQRLCQTCGVPGAMHFRPDGTVRGRHRGGPWTDEGRWEIIEGAAVRHWDPGAFEVVWLIERQGDRFLMADAASDAPPSVYVYSE